MSQTLVFAPTITTAFTGAHRLFKIIDRIPQVDSPHIANKSRKADKRTNIKFKHIDFRYPTRSDVQILNGFNLNIIEGKTVALVGPSGIFDIILAKKFSSFNCHIYSKDVVNRHAFNYSNGCTIQNKVEFTSVSMKYPVTLPWRIYDQSSASYHRNQHYSIGQLLRTLPTVITVEKWQWKRLSKWHELQMPTTLSLNYHKCVDAFNFDETRKCFWLILFAICGYSRGMTQTLAVGRLNSLEDKNKGLPLLELWFEIRKSYFLTKQHRPWIFTVKKWAWQNPLIYGD